MNPPDDLGRSVLAAYRHLGPRVRWHTTLRWWSCPFPVLERTLPEQGRILDLGCGHGLLTLLLAISGRDRTVVGVDVDEAKIEIARSAAAAAAITDRAHFEVVDASWIPSGRWDAVVCNDVLYLVGHERARRLIAAMARSISGSGRVVIKEVGERPAWKRRVNRVQEAVTTGLLGVNVGDAVDPVPTSVIESTLAGCGLRVATIAIDRGFPHAHVLVTGDGQVGSGVAAQDPSTSGSRS